MANSEREANVQCWGRERNVGFEIGKLAQPSDQESGNPVLARYEIAAGEIVRDTTLLSQLVQIDLSAA